MTTHTVPPDDPLPKSGPADHDLTLHPLGGVARTEAAPAQDALVFAVAREAFDKRMWSDAANRFSQLLGSASHSADARYGLGMVELELGSTARARALFRETVRRHPWHGNAWYQLGRLAEAESVPDAVEYYHHALSADPLHYGATYRLRLLDGNATREAAP